MVSHSYLHTHTHSEGPTEFYLRLYDFISGSVIFLNSETELRHTLWPLSRSPNDVPWLLTHSNTLRRTHSIFFEALWFYFCLYKFSLSWDTHSHPFPGLQMMFHSYPHTHTPSETHLWFYLKPCDFISGFVIFFKLCDWAETHHPCTSTSHQMMFYSHSHTLTLTETLLLFYLRLYNFFKQWD